jgi:hypothetical protein
MEGILLPAPEQRIPILAFLITEKLRFYFCFLIFDLMSIVCSEISRQFIEIKVNSFIPLFDKLSLSIRNRRHLVDFY